MLEIIQLNHLLTNTSNAEKATLIQQENVPIYHELAVERMNKKTNKNLKQIKKLKKSNDLKVKENKKEHSKDSRHGTKNAGNNKEPSVALSELYILDIEI